MAILLGTKNKNKVRELEQIWKEIMENEEELISLETLPYVEEPVEDGNSFFENAQKKAIYYFDTYKIPVIADDSGLIVEALHGQPGIHSARYASSMKKDANDKANREKLLREMKGIAQRRAYYQCNMVYYDGIHLLTSEGILEGSILEQEVGNHGFGYDCIFQVTRFNQSLGMLDDKTKNRISHRRLAFETLLRKIKSQL